MSRTRARRSDPPERTRLLGVTGADHVSTFAVEYRAGDTRTAEQWARSVFEEVPAPVSVVLILAWRVLLRLPSRPRTDAEHVLGWHIRSRERDLVVLEQRSRLMAATNVVEVGPRQVSWTTTVDYLTPAARLVWAIVLPGHLVTIARLLGWAAGSVRADPTRRL